MMVSVTGDRTAEPGGASRMHLNGRRVAVSWQMLEPAATVAGAPSGAGKSCRLPIAASSSAVRRNWYCPISFVLSTFETSSVARSPVVPGWNITMQLAR